MAVDANVLIYERIREEIGQGQVAARAPSPPVTPGRSAPSSTRNLTTLISSVILMYMGTGSVKGFGVALTIGVAASMFTSLVVTRLIFDWLLDRGWLKSLPMLHLIRATKLDFMKLAKPAFVASWLLIAIGVRLRLPSRQERLRRGFPRRRHHASSPSQQKRRTKPRSAPPSTKAGIKDPLIQYQTDLTSGRKTLRVDSRHRHRRQSQDRLAEELPDAQLHSC